MRFLIISLVVMGTVSSCALKTTKDLIEVTPTQEFYVNPYFSDSNQDYVYKTKIHLKDNFFGGLLVFKKIGSDQHRVVFTTDFGNKIFDFELQGSTFKAHFIIEPLDRSFIVKTLVRDFQMLTQEKFRIAKNFKDTTYLVHQSKQKNRRNHHFVHQETNKLERIINTTATKEKVIVTYSGIDKTSAEIIKIEHQGLQLTIDLFYIQN